MAFSTFELQHELLAADLTRRIRPSAKNRKRSILRIADVLRGVAVGAYRGEVKCRIGAVKATATITLTGDVSNNETFVICGTTFTAKSSGASGNQFNITTSDTTTTAAAIAAAVNASATTNVTGAVVASSALGVVTFTAKYAGAMGNGFVLTESLSNATRVDFAGGSDGTLTTLAAGGAS